jgi:hypothetical protein
LAGILRRRNQDLLQNDHITSKTLWGSSPAPRQGLLAPSIQLRFQGGVVPSEDDLAQAMFYMKLISNEIWGRR